MTVWCAQQPLILASQSATRQMLLRNAGIAVEAVPADINERDIQASSGLKAPGAIASLLAQKKALHVSALHKGRYVIGADQTLSLGERLFSKPGSRAAAAEQITALVGQTHELHSAVALAKDGEVVFSNADVAWMTMRALDRADIAAYLDIAGEAVTSSVGAYQLEGAGVHLFARINGDHFTILGLPLLPLLTFLRSQKLLMF
jgi:septum formation protein